jgi:glycosyltransferase involved in cell wall biosynthesis
MSHYRPLVSAVLLAYNCERFIDEALKGVVEQDYENLEIVISDDASEDGTFTSLQRETRRLAGQRHIDLRRRCVNSGSKSAHLNDVLRHLSGEIVVFFDGDDISGSSRVRKLLDAFAKQPEVQAVYSAYSLIDENGRALGRSGSPGRPLGASASAWFARVGAYASGGTLAIRRSVVDAFGPLLPDVHEDITLPFRASVLGDVVYVDETLVNARRHTAGLTQDFSVYASEESYRARFIRGVERARAVRDSRLEDLRAAEALMPERVQEFEALQAVVSGSANVAEKSAGLVSTSFWRRLSTFLHITLSEYYLDSFFRDLSLVLVPRLYLRYKRHHLNSRPGRAENGPI